MKKITKKVFISHSSIDEEDVHCIKDVLIQAGIKEDLIFCTALPETGIHGNDNPQEIVDNLEMSKFNIILFSINYIKKSCLFERGWCNLVFA